MFSATLAFIDGLGAPEMMLIFVIVLVLFGGQKLPEFARGLGKSIREFKKAAAGVEEEFKRALEEDERKHATPALPAASSEPVTTPATDTSIAGHSDPGGPYVDSHANDTYHDEVTDDVHHGPDHHTATSETTPPAVAPAEPTILAPAPPTPATPPSPAAVTPPIPSAPAPASPASPAPVSPAASSPEKAP